MRSPPPGRCPLRGNARPARGLRETPGTAAAPGCPARESTVLRRGGAFHRPNKGVAALHALRKRHLLQARSIATSRSMALTARHSKCKDYLTIGFPDVAMAATSGTRMNLDTPFDRREAWQF